MTRRLQTETPDSSRFICAGRVSPNLLDETEAQPIRDLFSSEQRRSGSIGRAQRQVARYATKSHGACKWREQETVTKLWKT